MSVNDYCIVHCACKRHQTNRQARLFMVFCCKLSARFSVLYSSTESSLDSFSTAIVHSGPLSSLSRDCSSVMLWQRKMRSQSTWNRIKASSDRLYVMKSFALLGWYVTGSSCLNLTKVINGTQCNLLKPMFYSAEEHYSRLH